MDQCQQIPCDEPAVQDGYCELHLEDIQVARASVPDLGALMKRAIASGAITPTSGYSEHDGKFVMAA